MLEQYSQYSVHLVIKFTMNGERDALKRITSEKKDIKLHGDGYKLNKNGAENGKSCHESFEDFEQTPIWIAVMTYIAYAILILFGYVRDFMRFYGLEKSRAFKERKNKVGEAVTFLFCFDARNNNI